jgi:hypothetical protein
MIVSIKSITCFMIGFDPLLFFKKVNIFFGSHSRHETPLRGQHGCVQHIQCFVLWQTPL